VINTACWHGKRKTFEITVNPGGKYDIVSGFNAEGSMTYFQYAIFILFVWAVLFMGCKRLKKKIFDSERRSKPNHKPKLAPKPLR